MDLRRLCALRHCFVVVLVIALGDLLVRVSATNSPSPVCNNLDIVSETKQTSAIPGSGLPYCATEDLQCCTMEYLMSEKSKLTTKLVDEIHQDILPTLMKWRQSYDASIDGLDEILQSFTNILTIPEDLRPIFSDFLAEQRLMLKTQIVERGMSDLDYNFTEHVLNLTGSLVDGFTMIKLQDPLQQMCADAVLHQHFNLTAVANVGKGFSQLQRVYHTLVHLQGFVNQLVANFTDVFQYSPSEQCLDALLSQYCGRCRQNIPTLCNGVCSAVLIGCQSPVQDGLRSQFDAVWNITRQLLSIAGELANQILCIDEPRILSPHTIFSLRDRFENDCGIPNFLDLLGISSGRRRRRRLADQLPSSIPMAQQIIQDLQGTFAYGSAGPHFCHGESTVTACWNGTITQAADPINISIISLSLEEQHRNPAYRFNVRGLKEQAIALGYPVIDLLEKEEYHMITPAGLITPNVSTMVLPSATPTPPVPTLSPSPTPSGSVSHTQHSTWLTVTLTSLFILFATLHLL